MLSDDAFSNLLTDTKRALMAWADRYDNSIDIVIDDDPSYWRIHALPSEASLCPIELVLRPDRNYDLVIADAAVEDQPIERFELFTELFEAVAVGEVVVQTHFSRATQQQLGTTTRVPLPDGTDWSAERLTALGKQLGLADAIVSERRFAGYGG